VWATQARRRRARTGLHRRPVVWGGEGLKPVPMLNSR
jgi:hypothetical protein